MREIITKLTKNKVLIKIIRAIIIGLTLLDVILLTGTLFIKVSAETYHNIVIFDLMVVIILMIQYLYKLNKSDDKIKYVKNHWFDLVGMVPEILLGNYSTILRYFRLIKILSLLRRSLVNFFEYIEKAHLELGFVTLIFILISGAAIFYFFEFGINENVNSLDDALWYILITITTVGYGDIYPKTVGGRVATILIIIAGISFISYVAIKITGLFFEETEKKENEIEDKLDIIDAKMDKIQSELEELKEIIENK